MVLSHSMWSKYKTLKINFMTSPLISSIDWTLCASGDSGHFCDAAIRLNSYYLAKDRKHRRGSGRGAVVPLSWAETPYIRAIFLKEQ